MDFMGLKEWLARARSSTDEPRGHNDGASVSDEVALAGTTTIAKAEVAALIERHRLPDRGVLDTTAALCREPDNPADPAAVAVFVDGERIGSLPSATAKQLPLHPGVELWVPMRLFSLMQSTGLRGEAWVWLGGGAPHWRYSAANPPPLTPEEKRTAESAWRTNLVEEALAEGGQRAEQFRAGMVGGVHYIELAEPIKQLKREGRLDEALALCYQAIEGAEWAAEGREPAPAYTEHAAIILRKLGQRDEEVAVLRRWLDHAPPDRREGSKIAQRLAKLQR